MAASADLPPGRYCYANPDSGLTMTIKRPGSAEIDLSYSPRRGGHGCGLQGDVTAIPGGWRYREDQCEMDILFAGDGAVSFRDKGRKCRELSCGANAAFDGIRLAGRDRKRC